MFTVIIPFVSTDATEWHPTTSTGSFSTLQRGAFPTAHTARAWADHHLAGHPYSVRLVRANIKEGYWRRSRLPWAAWRKPPVNPVWRLGAV